MVPGRHLLVCLSLTLVLGGCAHTRPARWVKSLSVRGNRAISDGEIEKGLATRQTSWVPFSKRREYNPSELEIDRRRIERLYGERGYFDVRVGAPELKEVGRGAVEITIPVDEGKPTSIAGVRLEGLPALEEPERKRLERELGLSTGAQLDYRRYERAKAALLRFLRQRGYPYAAVTGDIWIARQDRRAQVVIVARPGPQVRLGELRAAGEGRIPGRVIQLQRPWDPGDLYDPDDISLLNRRLNALGVFSSISIALPDAPVSEADVAVRVTPGRLRRVRLGGGFGLERRRHEVHLVGEWAHRNFLGGLRTLRLQVKPAWVLIPAVWDVQRNGPAVTSELELQQPYLLGTRFSTSALVGYDVAVEEGYRYHGPRTRLLVERPLLRDLLRVGLSWNLQYLMFFDINQAVFDPGTTPLGLGFRDSYRLAWLEPTVILDWRDQPLDARRGVYFETRFEAGLPEVGGDFRYLKITPDLRGYLPLGRRLAVAGRAMLGWMRPLVDEDTPVTRRYVLGGPTSHRGFSYGRLSPQARDPASGEHVPLGGNGALLFSVEVRLRMFQVFGLWVNLVPFLDAGDVVARFEDLQLGRLHLAVGGSLAYETPIGAVRAGVGVRLNRLGERSAGGQPNPDPGQRIAFHLTLGAAF